MADAWSRLSAIRLSVKTFPKTENNLSEEAEVSQSIFWQNSRGWEAWWILFFWKFI
jgi:hypothetical protein